MSSKAQDEANKNKLQQVVKEVVKRSAPFKRLFNSEDGKKVLQALKAEFKTINIVADNPHQTVINAAQRDVLDYIDIMINIKGEEENE